MRVLDKNERSPQSKGRESEQPRGEGQPMGTEQENRESNFEQLLAQYDRAGGLTEGEVLRGKIVEITSSEVVVDVGYKSEGAISVEEFRQPDGSIKHRLGDEVDVILESVEGKNGLLRLSREKAEKHRAWDDLETAFHEQRSLPGVVLGRTKGGLSVDIGVKAFLPGSQIDVRPTRNLDALIGQTIECRVIKLSKLRNNIVVSRKCILEEKLRQRREATLSNLNEGAVVKGTVKNVTDYGVFVDLGGIDGLLHISDISWGRLGHPSKRFSIGMEIQTVVLKFDREKERVSLGYKQLVADPWLSVTKKFPTGSKVQGKVASLADYGAFIELEEGIEGLVHVSEMSWTRRLKTPAEVVSTGDLVEVVVLDVQPAERRMALGMRQAVPDPWTGLGDRCSVGEVVQGRVANLTDFGAFVEIEDGIEGLIHVSDFNSFRKVKHPAEVLKKGETIKVIIMHIDAENHRLSLSYVPPQQNKGIAMAANAGVQGSLLSHGEKDSLRDSKDEQNP